MKASRVTALGLVLGASFWIASGYLLSHEHGESRAAARPTEPQAQKPFRVAVAEANCTAHSRKLVLSGRTEADRKVTVIARTGGVLTELRVRRGDKVEKGDVIAVLSDEAREAQVAQARALLAQRKAELEAKRRLIENGMMPKLDLVHLESQFKAAEAALAMAEAERDRGLVTAPWSGIVTETIAEVGQAAFSMVGREIAQIVSLDPMLAVVEVAERKLGGINVGDAADVRLVTGQSATGRIRYVAKTASATTRTYRVEVELRNPAGSIPDGITAEVAMPLAPVQATRVPRSALTLASNGDVGVRTANAGNTVAFMPVSVVEDDQTFMWVEGIPDGTRVIVQGQDFVREGQRVEAVVTAAVQTAGN
jgi:membrane fusion protein, multidrug efflux system